MSGLLLIRRVDELIKSEGDSPSECAAGLSVTLRNKLRGLQSNYQVLVGHFYGTLDGVELDNWLAIFYIHRPEHARKGWKDEVMQRIRPGSNAPSGVEVIEQAFEIPQSVDSNGVDTCVTEKLTTIDCIDALREIVYTLISHGHVSLVEEPSLIAVCSDVPFYLIEDGRKDKSERELLEEFERYIGDEDERHIAELLAILRPTRRWVGLEQVMGDEDPSYNDERRAISSVTCQH
ncbi:uncharacterized protein BDV14DRAFT_165612 [Aspergillus stella-maris]|uniref:uncharacterized protein n=1 Tax=Aspergillus stella-maris TaxID=1810926 RepID=UPI003CCCDA73